MPCKSTPYTKRVTLYTDLDSIYSKKSSIYEKGDSIYAKGDSIYDGLTICPALLQENGCLIFTESGNYIEL